MRSIASPDRGATIGPSIQGLHIRDSSTPVRVGCRFRQRRRGASGWWNPGAGRAVGAVSGVGNVGTLGSGVLPAWAQGSRVLQAPACCLSGHQLAVSGIGSLGQQLSGVSAAGTTLRSMLAGNLGLANGQLQRRFGNVGDVNLGAAISGHNLGLGNVGDGNLGLSQLHSSRVCSRPGRRRGGVGNVGFGSTGINNYGLANMGVGDIGFANTRLGNIGIGAGRGPSDRDREANSTSAISGCSTPAPAIRFFNSRTGNFGIGTPAGLAGSVIANGSTELFNAGSFSTGSPALVTTTFWAASGDTNTGGFPTRAATPAGSTLGV